MSEQKLYNLRLSKVTGLLIYGQRSAKTYTGTKEQLAEIYKKVQTYNAIVGWWGIVAIVWNIRALISNARAKKKLDIL